MKIKHIFFATLIFALVIGLPMATFAREAESGGVLEVELGDDRGNDALKTTVTTQATTTVTPGTSSALHKAVDSLITKIDNMKEGEFCGKISAAVVGLSKAEQASLAWKADSYSKNLSLSPSANATAEEKAEYENLKTAYAKITTSLSADSGITANDRAAIRGAYLELMSEYRDGTIDSDRVSRIRSFIQDAANCLKDSSGVKTAVAANDTDVKAGVTVTREDLMEDDYDVAVPATTSVKSDSSLRSFIAINVAKYDNIKSITSDETKTETIYKQRGRLFGLVPLRMTVHSTVHADGTAEVRYPWYKFMTSAVGGKVSSETILETAKITKSEKLSTEAQASAIDASVKAFATVEEK